MAFRDVTETKTATRRQLVCDRCEKAMDSPRTCTVCKRDCCYFCAGSERFYRDLEAQRILDPCGTVCKVCMDAGAHVVGEPFVETIRDVVIEADMKIDALLGRWRAWAKEREGGKP